MAVNRKVINSCPISSPASWPASISRLCLSWGFAPPLGRVYMLLVLRIQHFTQLRTKTRQLFGNEWTENKFTQRREKKKDNVAITRFMWEYGHTPCGDSNSCRTNCGECKRAISVRGLLVAECNSKRSDAHGCSYIHTSRNMCLTF